MNEYSIQKRRARQSKWLKENTKGFYIRLCKKTDADIIEFLAQLENKQGFVKQLIRDAMHKM